MVFMCIVRANQRRDGTCSQSILHSAKRDRAIAQVTANGVLEIYGFESVLV